MSPTKLPNTTTTTLSQDDRNNIRTAWIWAALIIGIGVVLGGLTGELSRRGATADSDETTVTIVP